MNLLKLFGFVNITLFSCFSLSAVQSFETIIPDAIWEPIYFQEINKTTDELNLGRLREASIGQNSLEVRVWIGFGLSFLEGYIFRKEGAAWNFYYIPPSFERDLKILNSPNSGADSFLINLTNSGLFTLPDSSQLINEVGVLDGVGYVVEIMQPDIYRTYMYSNPAYQNWPEAEMMIDMINFIKSEFK